jgi:outer membrane protein OmpA-like peptidoglycan-associated protein
MNTLSPRTNLVAIGVACALLAACAASPTKPDGAENLRYRLTQLQTDPRLGNQAPLAMKQADEAVTKAEQPQADKAVSAHLIFMAGRKIDIAQAEAEGKYAVAERATLDDKREAMRLQSRTVEADAANARAAVAHADASYQLRAADAARNQTVMAQADALNQRQAADAARIDADRARDANDAAQRNSAELQQQIDDLHAKATERGLVLTLGDLLFSSGTARLNRSGNDHLDKLAAFLNRYPERNVTVEGYTDSVGTEDYNLQLSQRRADAVKAYLMNGGIMADRITTSGRGEDSPVGDNATASGRQQNRRVEIVITNNTTAAR